MADTTITTTEQRAVLIVAPSPDQLLLQLGQSLSETGANVHFTTDVYMAMARLATGEHFGHVVVEAASLDDYERAFLTIAPQYYETSSFYVPARTILDERMLAQGRYEILSPDGIVDAVLGIRDAESADEATNDDEWSQPRTIGEAPQAPQPPDDVSTAEPPAPPTLSTDGGLEEEDDRPSLHDAVRERMGANPTQRRRPPGSSEPPPAPPAESDTRVSREEMDALLGPDDDESMDDMTDAARDEDEDAR